MKKRLEVIWSEESDRRTDDIIDYLRNKFSEKEVSRFIDLLKSFERLFPDFLKHTLNLLAKKESERQ